MSDPVDRLLDLVGPDGRVVALTGAGISVESGIPPYRDHGGNWLGSQPIQHQEFIDDEAKRRRYWARSAAGWPAVAEAKPNQTHRSLVDLERCQFIRLLVTQNVDRLHQRAGHRNVIDLHGRLDQASCLSCGVAVDRALIQQQLLSENPALVGLTGQLAPDGDAAVAEAVVDDIVAPRCARCDGVMKPDVVFFGGAVPTRRVQAVTESIAECDALLTIGTSLMVYSGFRFCRQARELGKPVIAINQGTTRADDFLDLKIEADCAAVLAQVRERLNARQ